MRARGGLALPALLAISCGGTDISDFQYGGGQPGAALAEGGEIRHENVRIFGLSEQSWIQVYQYTGPEVAANAKFGAPDPESPFFPCVDLRGTWIWPVAPIEGASYLDLPKVELTGPGIDGVLDIVKTDPPNTFGNSTFRAYDFTYGGGAPGDPPSGFNGTLTAAQSQPGGEYVLDIGKAAPMHYFMPEAYAAPLGIGGADTVMIPDGEELTFSWTPPPNDFGESGTEHNRRTHFKGTFFGDPTDGAANHGQFLCFPEVEGTQTIPKAVIDELTPGGLISHFDITHFMESVEAAPGEQRRFDLVAIYCNISLYQKITP